MARRRRSDEDAALGWVSRDDGVLKFHKNQFDLL